MLSDMLQVESGFQTVMLKTLSFWQHYCYNTKQKQSIIARWTWSHKDEDPNCIPSDHFPVFSFGSWFWIALSRDRDFFSNTHRRFTVILFLGISGSASSASVMDN
jgi:hypothetical protein